MQFSSTVTQKGQATIPAPIRKKLGIKPNSKVVFELNKKNGAVIRPIPDFLSFQGSLKSDKPFDIEAMDKAVEEAVAKEYAKKSS